VRDRDQTRTPKKSQQAAKATPFAAGNEGTIRQKRRRRLLP
jgi:hypothetical protein